MSDDNTDCRTPEGVATGVVDTIITQLRVLRTHYADALPPEALKDLIEDPDLRWLLEHAVKAADPSCGYCKGHTYAVGGWYCPGCGGC